MVFTICPNCAPTGYPCKWETLATNKNVTMMTLKYCVCSKISPSTYFLHYLTALKFSLEGFFFFDVRLQSSLFFFLEELKRFLGSEVTMEGVCR